MNTLSVITPVLAGEDGSNRMKYFFETAYNVIEFLRLAKTEVMYWKINWALSVNGEYSEQWFDTTKDLLNDKVCKELNIQIIRNPEFENKMTWPSTVRNFLLNEITSEWVYPLDADDKIDTENMVNLLNTVSVLDQTKFDYIVAPRYVMNIGKDAIFDFPLYRNRELGDTEILPKGIFYDKFQQFGELPIWPTHIIYNREKFLRYTGGYGNVKILECMYALSLLTEYVDGIYIHYPINQYRIWGEQMVQEPDTLDNAVLTANLINEDLSNRTDIPRGQIDWNYFSTKNSINGAIVRTFEKYNFIPDSENIHSEDV